MARTVSVNIRLDENDKKNMEQVCEGRGLSAEDAFAILPGRWAERGVSLRLWRQKAGGEFVYRGNCLAIHTPTVIWLWAYRFGQLRGDARQ